jgi:hypothetical protein
MDIQVEAFGISSQGLDMSQAFEMGLKMMKPDTVVLMEPNLEFIRMLELYNAERTQL